MKRLGTILLFCAVSLSARSVAMQQPDSPEGVAGSASIAGSVINSLTRKPLEGVHIVLAEMASNAPPSFVYGAMSGADGRFFFRTLAPGNYVILMDRRGFIRVPGKGPGATGLAVPVKAGQRLQNVMLEMTPRPILAGRVIDEYGDPVMNAYVNVERVVPQELEFVRTQAVTNDRGEFRIGVPPGKYYLKVVQFHSVQGKAEIRSDGSVDSEYLETYYPGTTSAEGATPVEARAGRELRGLEIRLARSPALNISGTITGVPDDALSLSLWVEWGPTAEEIQSGSTEGWSAPTRKELETKFQLSHLAAGFYKISARCSDGGGQEMRSRAAEISLTDSNVEGVNLECAPGANVTGHVSWAGQPPPATPGENPTVILEQIVMGSENPTAEIGADGAFTIKNLFPDRYRVTVGSIPEDSFVKAVRLNETLLRDNILDFSNGAESAELNITLSARGGQVSGHIVDEKGIAPWPAGMLVLFPDSGELPPYEQVIVHNTDENSAFQFHALPPGKYKLFVVPIGTDLHLRSRTGLQRALERYGRTAEVIRIQEGDKISRDVKTVHTEAGDETQP